MTAKVAVAIPNFNGEAVLPACLEALGAQTTPPEEVVVADNGSTDGSVAMIRQRFPDVKVVALPGNLGFAGGANRAVAATSAARVAVLNSDAVADPRWLARLVDEADRSPRDVWAWGTVLLRPDGLVESAGDQYSPEGRAYKLGTGVRPDDLPREPYEVFAPPGAAPLFRRDVFDDLGGFCERFFLYYEDVDLAFRARLRGHRAVMVTAATVTHDQGATSRRQPSRAAWFIARNSLWCAVRNLPGVTAASLTKVSVREARWARSKGGLRPFMAGRAAGVAGLPWALRERRRIQGGRVVDDATVVSFLDEPPALAGVVATHVEGSR